MPIIMIPAIKCLPMSCSPESRQIWRRISGQKDCCHDRLAQGLAVDRRHAPAGLRFGGGIMGSASVLVHAAPHRQS
ncbi:hypothetical protein MTBSS4_110121 [Magnetospirillum sp. SS-4]|nr:hypothetical protein MTBSS4_110121 [Magnetospirillum sp. SS-4]